MTKLCLCGCGEPVTIKQGRVWNDYVFGHAMRRPPPTLSDIQSRTVLDPVTKCWNWTRATACGYGVIKTQQRQYKVSRYVFSLVNGSIPSGTVVRHKCDNRLCCNPDHLELGSYQDNTNDMVLRGRSKRGIKHHNTRLSEDDVIEILTSNLPQKVFVDKFDIGPQHVSNIVKGKTWVHVFECLLLIVMLTVLANNYKTWFFPKISPEAI